MDKNYVFPFPPPLASSKSIPFMEIPISVRLSQTKYLDIIPGSFISWNIHISDD